MSEFENLIETITKQIEIGGKVFVYYDKEDGKILRIANRMVDELAEKECLLSPRQDVLPVMNGFKRLEDYVVSYDPILKDFRVVEKENDVKNLSINDRLYEIESTSGNNYDITIIQNVQEKAWIIKLHPKVAALLKKTQFNQNKILVFTITKKNDPNVLYRRIETNLLDILNEGSVEFPYLNEWEFENFNVSIYTNKYFDDYKHEIKL